MAPGMTLLLEGTLTFGVPVAVCVRELILMRRGRGGGRSQRVDPGMPAPPDISGARPLPACLVPVPVPVGTRRERMLEPVD